MAKFGVPVIISPTTIRAGYKTRLVVKDSYETIAGDGSFIGKYDIPEVVLEKCLERLDFACLLAIGTTPINIQAKQLDGLDKSINLRSVRPTGLASYQILAGSIQRGQIQLITNYTPEPAVKKQVLVLVNNLAISTENEGTLGVSVFVNGLDSSVELELNGSVVEVRINTQNLTSSESEGTNGVSVKIDGSLVSTQTEL